MSTWHSFAILCFAPLRRMTMVVSVVNGFGVFKLLSANTRIRLGRHMSDIQQQQYLQDRVPCLILAARLLPMVVGVL